MEQVEVNNGADSEAVEIDRRVDRAIPEIRSGVIEEEQAVDGVGEEKVGGVA